MQKQSVPHRCCDRDAEKLQLIILRGCQERTKPQDARSQCRSIPERQGIHESDSPCSRKLIQNHKAITVSVSHLQNLSENTSTVCIRMLCTSLSCAKSVRKHKHRMHQSVLQITVVCRISQKTQAQNASECFAYHCHGQNQSENTSTECIRMLCNDKD